VPSCWRVPKRFLRAISSCDRRRSTNKRTSEHELIVMCWKREDETLIALAPTQQFGASSDYAAPLGIARGVGWHRVPPPAECTYVTITPVSFRNVLRAIS
jgi:hypothetical protein